MSYTSALEDMENVPEWSIGSGGTIKPLKQTQYFTDAQRDIQAKGSRNLIGYWVKCPFDKKFMTVLQAKRMADMFERGILEIIDYVYSDAAHEHFGLEGYDTEGIEALDAFGT